MRSTSPLALGPLAAALTTLAAGCAAPPLEVHPHPVAVTLREDLEGTFAHRAIVLGTVGPAGVSAGTEARRTVRFEVGEEILAARDAETGEPVLGLAIHAHVQVETRTLETGERTVAFTETDLPWPERNAMRVAPLDLVAAAIPSDRPLEPMWTTVPLESAGVTWLPRREADGGVVWTFVVSYWDGAGELVVRHELERMSAAAP